jgi:nuclear pore complex protein Nup107
MAPMTRRSMAAATAAANTAAAASSTGISKPVTRRSRAAAASTRKEQSESWELLDDHRTSQADADNFDHADEHDEAADMDFSTTRTGGAVKTATDSLRDIADRVGKEVEIFAETLDRFFDNLPSAQDQYDAAHDLVLEFKGIAEEAVEDLKRGHEREVREQLRTEWSEQAHLSAFGSTGRAKARTTFGGAAAAAERKMEQVEELRLCQEEADTWELFRVVLELHYNPNAPSKVQEKEEQLARLGHVHRYTSESELYDRFLVEDDLARERHMLKTWLEQTAEHQKSDVSGIVEELEERAGAGKGSWTRGWMHTREKIKAEKRMRTWPQPDSSPLPQIRRTDNNEMLVTSLDPDAPARQERTLEKQDAYIERAFWIACYEMLRRGKPWSEVCDWCEERKEGWRAVAMGKTMAISDTASNMAWRKMCFLASRSETAGDYEAAVYGLLGGNVEAVKKISRSVDDHLYAHYNAVLIQQFDHFLEKNYPERIPQTLSRPGHLQDSIADVNAAQLEILTLVHGLRKNSTTRHESTTPIKMLQSYLLANETESLVHTVGAAISDVKNVKGNPGDMTNRIQALIKHGSGYPEDKIVTDPRSLRIATHICLILQVLRESDLEADEQEIEDNVVDAYIQELRTAGKRDNTPVYASRLQKHRYTVAMSRVFQDVSSVREREELLSLVAGFRMSPKDILWELTNFLQEEMFGETRVAKGIRILESTEEELYPGQRVRAGVLPVEVSPEEEAFVMSYQWFQQLQGHWTETFLALKMGLRDCLCEYNPPGNLHAIIC